ncbi:MAG: hypothetical protein A2015_16765 [Spirochaetes bacterium GWF1_31_7]|nr:MAG: hypothetical protein A2Y30_14130 [Spirochaetes bacterium GWE1_32_154]OHD50095.1 MAG: hypothetical protein A2Y29_12175 [Spirochaetes bacterium GWE2_31_10]OHD52408.1 MAG: hypothetical protein A2015_16765 [Spirochaetes bacterium GWF1_31_7]OHD74309.1 MAG: hypothetical protein A2355_12115 [Spirochaetes bacterium RIFOXYB1_FULL_32_8]HBD96052.1 hypothetical protein [Spirochaetia bacterium]
MKNFLKVDDFTKEEIITILNRADFLQECWVNNLMPKTLKNKKIALWFFGQGFFMPCPPIMRGQEVSEDSLTTSQYCDYQAKEYLLHSQNAIMEYCFNEKFA